MLRFVYIDVETSGPSSSDVLECRYDYLRLPATVFTGTLDNKLLSMYRLRQLSTSDTSVEWRVCGRDDVSERRRVCATS